MDSSLDKPNPKSSSLFGSTFKTVLLAGSIIVVWLFENLSKKSSATSDKTIVKGVGKIIIESDKPIKIYKFLFEKLKLKNEWLPSYFTSYPLDIFCGGLSSNGTTIEVMNYPLLNKMRR